MSSRDFTDSASLRFRPRLIWDDVIQRTCQHALDGSYVGTSNVLLGRSAIHEMAKEPRFVRRALSERMTKAIREFPESPGKLVRKLTYMESFYPGKAHVFLQLKVVSGTTLAFGSGHARQLHRPFLPE